MTRNEYNEVHAIAERLERLVEWAKWVLGGVSVLGMAAALWVFEMESRVSLLEQYKKTSDEQIERVALGIDRLRSVPVRIESQSEKIDRIELMVDALAKYIRGQYSNEQDIKLEKEIDQ